MLVLSRRIGETVKIDGDIEVTISKIAGSSVQLAFNAPLERRIIRSELEEGSQSDGTGANRGSSTGA